MSLSFNAKRVVQETFRRCRGGVGAATSTQIRSHHPDPFNPKQTRGWKAALKVRERHSRTCFLEDVRWI